MKTMAALACAGAMLALWLGSDARGDSIYAKAGNRAVSLTSDDVARRVGDNLTIVINERSVISNDTNRNMEKKTARSDNFSGTFDLGNIFNGGSTQPPRQYKLPTVNVNDTSDNKFDGAAKYGSDRSLTDQITVVVEDVLPNGNLVVLGQRTREMDGDTQIIQLSGIVRPSDISFANAVGSDRVADFHIVYKAKGQESTYTRPGWLARILNYTSPQ